jgi:hypothetical protein
VALLSIAEHWPTDGAPDRYYGVISGQTASYNPVANQVAHVNHDDAGAAAAAS